jgi:hypothetical protein
VTIPAKVTGKIKPSDCRGAPLWSPWRAGTRPCPYLG